MSSSSMGYSTGRERALSCTVGLLSLLGCIWLREGESCGTRGWEGRGDDSKTSIPDEESQAHFLASFSLSSLASSLYLKNLRTRSLPWQIVTELYSCSPLSIRRRMDSNSFNNYHFCQGSRIVRQTFSIPVDGTYTSTDPLILISTCSMILVNVSRECGRQDAIRRRAQNQGS